MAEPNQCPVSCYTSLMHHCNTFGIEKILILILIGFFLRSTFNYQDQNSMKKDSKVLDETLTKKTIEIIENFRVKTLKIEKEGRYKIEKIQSTLQMKRDETQKTMQMERSEHQKTLEMKRNETQKDFQMRTEEIVNLRLKMIERGNEPEKERDTAVEMLREQQVSDQTQEEKVEALATTSVAATADADADAKTKDN